MISPPNRADVAGFGSDLAHAHVRWCGDATGNLRCRRQQCQKRQSGRRVAPSWRASISAPVDCSAIKPRRCPRLQPPPTAAQSAAMIQCPNSSAAGSLRPAGLSLVADMDHSTKKGPCRPKPPHRYRSSRSVRKDDAGSPSSIETQIDDFPSIVTGRSGCARNGALCNLPIAPGLPASAALRGGTLLRFSRRNWMPAWSAAMPIKTIQGVDLPNDVPLPKPPVAGLRDISPTGRSGEDQAVRAQSDGLPGRPPVTRDHRLPR